MMRYLKRDNATEVHKFKMYLNDNTVNDKLEFFLNTYARPQ